MSLITIDQFDEFIEAYPEMAQCYEFMYNDYDEEDLIGDTCAD